MQNTSGFSRSISLVIAFASWIEAAAAKACKARNQLSPNHLELLSAAHQNALQQAGLV